MGTWQIILKKNPQFACQMKIYNKSGCSKMKNENGRFSNKGYSLKACLP
jgi:hypothetical protein